MQFRILGTLEVEAGDRAVKLGAAKQRALLAILLLHANEPLSTDRLIDELWGESPPATASKALQVYVSQLRRLLDGSDGAAEAKGHSIATIPGGYTLRVAPDDLDSKRFELLMAEAERLAADGDPAAAAQVLERALSLWRGPALADFAFEPFARAEIARLEELRLGAAERRVDVALAAGRAADLIGELQATVSAHPLREHPRAQLMIALYRAGRQAEALEEYRNARRALAEVGIEPSQTLRGLEVAILNHDPSLAAHATIRPSGAPVFVGRGRELAELVEGLDQALAGRGRLFLVAGEPGIGKSRLAEELVERARERGARVLVGRCWEAGGAPAYWPWVQSLRPYLRDTGAAALREQLGDGAADVAQLVPELRATLRDLPDPPGLDSEGARFRLFDAVAAFLRNAAAARPLVLILDDLHAADEPSLLLLRFVAREVGRSRLLVLCAYRDVDPTLAAPLTSTVSELAREPVTRTLTLPGLAEPDVARFIELSSGRPAVSGLAATVHSETDGNPLFVGEVVRLLAAEGRLEEPAAAGMPIPPGVKDVIGRRLGHVSVDCGGMLTLASGLGREVDLDVLACLSGMERSELLGLLDAAVEQRLVAGIPGAIGQMRFAHALIRDTAYQELSPASRADLHREAAEAIEALHPDDLDTHLSELAHHYFAAAAAGGDRATAARYARRAAARAAELLAYEEAVRLYGMALTLTEGGTAARVELLLDLGNAQARAGDTPAAKDTYREAAELADSLGLPEQLARAAIGYGGRFIWEVWRDDPHVRSLLERAIAALPDSDSPLRVRLLARLGAGPMRDSRFPPERRMTLTAEALEAARRLGDQETLAYALAGYIGAHHSPDFAPEQVRLGGELIALAEQIGDLERGIEARDHRSNAMLELSDLAGAKAQLVGMAELADQLRQPPQKWLVLVVRAQHALLEGRLVDAEELIEQAYELGGQSQSSAVQSYRIQTFQLRLVQGRLAEVEDLVRRAAEEHSTYPICGCALARTALELGNEGEARASLAALTARDLAALPFDEEWMVSVCLLAEVACRLGDLDRASALYVRLLPYADRVAVSYPEIAIGAVARYLGLLAATTYRPDDAARHFEVALAVNERVGARPALADTQHDYARLLMERPAGSGRQAAKLLLHEAAAGYRELGMETYAAAASRALAAHS